MGCYESYGSAYVTEFYERKVTYLELIEPKIPLLNWHISPCWPLSWIFPLNNFTNPGGDSNKWFEHVTKKQMQLALYYSPHAWIVSTFVLDIRIIALQTTNSLTYRLLVPEVFCKWLIRHSVQCTFVIVLQSLCCLLYTSPSPRD